MPNACGTQKIPIKASVSQHDGTSESPFRNAAPLSARPCLLGNVETPEQHPSNPPGPATPAPATRNPAPAARPPPPSPTSFGARAHTLLSLHSDATPPPRHTALSPETRAKM